MKKLLSLTLFLMSISLLSAQDTSFSRGNSTIYLHSGKIIKSVVIWRIDSIKVEYVLKGNLTDVKTLDISKIETPDYLIEFDQEHHLIKNGYDLIILSSKDTLRGIVQRTDNGMISYQPIGSNKIKRAMKYEVENYVIWKEKAGLTADSVALQNSAQTTYREPDQDTLTKENFAETEENDYEMPKDAVEEVLKTETDNKYFIQSYERGVKDAISDNRKSVGWGGGGFILGVTIGSPFLSLGATNSKVVLEDVPTGVDDKLYRAGFENKIVQERARKVAVGAIIGKFLILLILIAGL